MRIAIIVLLAALQSAAAASQSQGATVRVTVRISGTMEPVVGATLTMRSASLESPAPPPYLAELSTAVSLTSGRPDDLLAYLAQLAQSRSSGGPVTITMGHGNTPPISLNATDVNGNAVYLLEPGHYTFTALRSGYVSGTAVITIDSQRQNQNVTIYVSRGASITGRVRNADGSARIEESVELATVGYRDGMRAVIQSLNTRTNLNGEFQASLLPPGTYLIRWRDPMRLAPYVYFPDTASFEKASLIQIQSTEKIVGIDIDIPDIPTFTVSGVIPNVQQVQSIAVVPRDVNVIPVDFLASVPNLRPGPNGAFEIAGIPAGSWDLFPMTNLETVYPLLPRYVTSRAQIDIVDRNVSGVSIAVGTADIAGRIVNSPGTAQPLRASLLPRDNVPDPLREYLRVEQPVSPNGEFAFKGIPLGQYTLQIIGLPSGFYASEIPLINLGTVPLAPLEIQIRSGTAGVMGSIRGIDPTGRAALVPAESRRQDVTLYQTTEVSTSGTFRFSNVPPGEYKVFVWANLPAGGAEMNKAFLSKYEEQGVPVIVREGQISMVQANLIPDRN